MEKITIIMWSIWIHINQVQSKKNHFNSSLIIMSNFQNLQEGLVDSLIQNGGYNVLQVVEKNIQLIRLINGKVKPIFDGSEIGNKNV